MRVTVRYFEGCATWRTAAGRVREALDRLGRHDAAVVPEQVDARGESASSPTILVAGRDLFGGDRAPAGPTCRLYANEGGLEGAPSVERLVEAIAALDPHAR